MAESTLKTSRFGPAIMSSVPNSQIFAIQSDDADDQEIEMEKKWFI